MADLVCIWWVNISEQRRVKNHERPRLMATPYDKLKSLKNAKEFLKPGVSFEQLDQESMQLNDLQSAKAVNAASLAMFKRIFNDDPVEE